MPIAPAVIFPLLLSLQPPVTELRKCIGAKGAVSYQSLPCAPGSRQAWAQPIKPGSAPPPPTAQASHGPGRRQAVPAKGKPARQAGPRRPSPAQVRRQRCDKARREADEQRDRLWNKLDFQQRSELDARVARACSRPG